MDCTAASGLIPGYLDGELSESQASPLRQHLLDCAACRSLAQDHKALESWFVAEPALQIPPGFAQRVARRAFAGDRGAAQWGERSAVEAEPKLRSFVLGLSALAAGLLFFFSLSLGGSRRPHTDKLWADNFSREAVLQRLDELNRSAEGQPEAAPQTQPAAPHSGTSPKKQ